MRRGAEFARWRSDFASGGNRYDEELTAALRALGLDLREHDVTGPWPCPEPQDRQRFAGMLAVGDDWLVDNIVGSAAPEIIESAVGKGRRVSLLVHYFPSDDASLPMSDRKRLAATEAAAVRAASNVVVTSAWSAGQIASRYGRDDAVVARPGVRAAGLAPGSAHSGGPPMLLWLGRLTATKDPLTFVDALSQLADLDWGAQLVGPDTVDEALSTEVHGRIAQAGLGNRVNVLGARDGDALETIWAETDLLVHTSRVETYGMVISEALAHGIPSVVATGSGAVEAQRAGGTFPPGDAAALTAALRTWLTDRQLRERWRSEATNLREHLPTWMDAARIVASMLAM